MVKIYDLIHQGKCIGNVKVERSGLYYNISCVCRPETTGIHRIIAASDSAEVDLGICVPMASAFGLETKVPIKKLGDDRLVFWIIHNDCRAQETFAEIHENEPFEFLSRLDCAKLIHRHGQAGVLLKQNQSEKEISSPTGQ